MWISWSADELGFLGFKGGHLFSVNLQQQSSVQRSVKVGTAQAPEDSNYPLSLLYATFPAGKLDSKQYLVHEE